MTDLPDSLSFLATGGEVTKEVFERYIQFLGKFYPDGPDQLLTVSEFVTRFNTLTLHPTPDTLHPTPYTLHHTPYTLHPTPYTLHLHTKN